MITDLHGKLLFCLEEIAIEKRLNAALLARVGLLCALSVVMTRLLSVRLAIGGVEAVRLGLGKLPIIFAGIFLGPLAGGLVGGISDVVGYMLSPMGAYMPHFTIGAALTGILPGLAINIAHRNHPEEASTASLFVAVLIPMVLITVLYTPYFQESLFGLSRAVTVPPRILEAVIITPVYTFLLKYLKKAPAVRQLLFSDRS